MKGPVDPSNPDELEVLGGRKSVIMKSSDSASPPAMHSTDTHPCDIKDGNSPNSQPGAAEMLMEYYQEIGNPAYEMLGRNNEMEEGNFPGEGFNPISKAKHQPSFPADTVPHRGVVNQYPTGTPTGTGHPSGSLDGRDYGVGKVPRQSTFRASGPWAVPYTNPHHPPHYQMETTVVENSYPRHLAGMPGYVFGGGQDQNQDEIWRNFARDFGGSA